jgi:tetratricopeptide (TPR) repeat protein
VKRLFGIIIALGLLVALGARAAEPIDVEDVLTRAREAASGDRHREAIDLFLRAIDADSSLVSEVALEIGHQYTWADMPDSAISWYELYLASHPGDVEASLGLARALSWADRLRESESYYRRLAARGETREEAAIGLARVVSWQDRLKEAEKIYRGVLEIDPASEEAALGLAQVINWSGRHRKAAKLYGGMLEKDPANTEAVVGLAAAENWMGLPYRALRRLDRAPAGDEVEKLESEIRASLRPDAELGYTGTRDSDEIDIKQVKTEVTVHSERISTGKVGYYFEEITQPGYPRIRRNAAYFTVSKRFSSSLSVTLSPGFERNRFEATALPAAGQWVRDFELFVWDSYVTLTPIDWFRLDAGFARSTLEIPVSIFKGIEVTSGTIGLDWRFLPSLAAFASARLSDLSDSNLKLSAAQRLEWRLPLRLPVGWKNGFVLSPGYDYFHYRKILDNGYYNPRDYLSVYTDLSITCGFGKILTFFVKGRLSLERENDTDESLLGAVEGSISIKPKGGFSLDAGYHNSRSRLDSPSGYRYTGFYVNLSHRF